MLSLAINEPPHAQSDKINGSTHCGEFNSLGGHEMLRESWGCMVEKKIYIERDTWTNQFTREEQRHHKANVPVSLGGIRQRSVIEVRLVTSYSVSRFSGDRCLLAVGSCCCGVAPYMSEHYK